MTRRTVGPLLLCLPLVPVSETNIVGRNTGVTQVIVTPPSGLLRILPETRLLLSTSPDVLTVVSFRSSRSTNTATLFATVPLTLPTAMSTERLSHTTDLVVQVEGWYAETGPTMLLTVKDSVIQRKRVPLSTQTTYTRPLPSDVGPALRTNIQTHNAAK